MVTRIAAFTVSAYHYTALPFFTTLPTRYTRHTLFSSEYFSDCIVVSSAPTFTAYRSTMSDIELNASMDMDTGILWDGEESEVEETSAPLPKDDLQVLVHGEKELFTPTQLVELVDSPPSVDPCLPSPRSPEVEAILEPFNLPWCQDVEEEEERRLLKSQEDSDLQHGQGDHSLLHTSAGSSSMVDSGVGVEQVPPQLKHGGETPDLAREACRQASLKAMRVAFSGRRSQPQPPNTRELGGVGLDMLRSWYQLEPGSVCNDRTVSDKIRGLQLVPEQQAILDSGLRADQWYFSRDQPLQAWSDCQCCLHASLVTHRQASHPLPPPHQPSTKPAAAQQDQVQFPAMDIRVKQGLLQGNKVQVDLRERLDQQRKRPSLEEGLPSSKAKVPGEGPRNKGVVGKGGHQSSSTHRGSAHGGQGSSTHTMGPPRPPPSATITSGSSSSASYAKVAAKGSSKP